jgi:hypothetical protein
MASGIESWTGELWGLDKATDLVPGPVPWQLVLALLGVWTLVTVLPNLWTCTERRWAATLDGVEMFRLRAKWKEAIWNFEGGEFKECERLTNVPGMVGRKASLD